MSDAFLEDYTKEINGLFASHPSFQKVGASAYKPGLERVKEYSAAHGDSHRKFRCIHVAGTNGKGTVCAMIAATLASQGYKVGLYTSPHIYDFRERIQVGFLRAEATQDDGIRHSEPVEESQILRAEATQDDGIRHSEPERSEGEESRPRFEKIPKEWVYNYLTTHKQEFRTFNLSFFEITTMMAFDYFASCEVDYAVIEVGLGGRLDATNIITPCLGIITSIGLDHTQQLGETLQEIAFEKAGIIKKGVPCLIGDGSPEINPIFEKKIHYVNNGEAKDLLHYAGTESLDDVLEKDHAIATCALKLLGFKDVAIEKQYANITGLSGRFETVSHNPLIIKDMGHNSHALRHSFKRLEELREKENYSPIIIYAKAQDKDYASIVKLMPHEATYIFTQADGPRATPAKELTKNCPGREIHVEPNRFKAFELAKEMANIILKNGNKPLIYIGGSTYILDCDKNL